MVNQNTPTPTGATSRVQARETLRYAGLHPRLNAFLWDLVVQIPIIGAVLWGFVHYRLFELYSIAPMTALMLFYDVYLVRRYGGTPGKLIAGIRIRKVDGEPVGWREAWLRYLPGWILSLLVSGATICGALRLGDPEYFARPLLDRHELILATAPFWHRYAYWLSNAWAGSEFLALLTNEKRRALHDFIAGTVVVFADKDAA